MKTILTKKCLVCGKEFTKPSTCSRRDWETRKYDTKECANKSKVGKPSWNAGIKTGFVPRSAFKKGNRPSPKTEFKKGSKPWNKGRNDYITDELRTQLG